VWALDLVAGNSDCGIEHNSTHAQFQVSVALTEAGMDHIQEVGNLIIYYYYYYCFPQVFKCIFEYLAMLKKIGPQKRIFDEIQTIEDNNFKWKEQVGVFCM
jgi:nardilysin